MINVAAAFIAEQGRFLIAKRAYGKLAGLWEFPGGKIEQGEKEHETVVREIKEELDLDVTAKEMIGVFTHSYPSADITLTLIECEKNDPSQEIVSNGSHTEFQWIDVSECINYEFPPVDTKIVAFLQAKK